MRGKRRSRATQRETLIMDGVWMKVKDSRDDSSQCGCDACVMKDKTSNSVQACSDLARRVTVVHIGLEGVVVVIHFYVAILFVIFRYQEMFSIHTPSVTVNCVDCYRCNHDNLCIKFLLRFMLINE